MTARMCRLIVAVAGVVALAALWNAHVQTQSTPAPRKVPEFRFDPDWPKPLPDVEDDSGAMRPQWTGGVAWVCVNQRNDHIVQLNRAHVENMPAGLNAVKVPPIVIRDYAGNAIRSIGDLSLTPEGRSKVVAQGSHGCTI